MKDLSIVVLNYNTSDLLPGALQSIVDTAGDISFSVTVIDNASEDGGFMHVPEALRRDSRFDFIVETKNRGWVAINRMLKSDGRYVATVDPDAVVHPGTLATLVAFMDAHPEVGAATAKLLNVDGTPQWYYRRILTPKLYFYTTVIGRLIDKYLMGLRQFNYYRYHGLNLTKPVEVEQPAWPCLVWRREAVPDFLVDDRIPFYFLDVDMSRRLYERGFKIYLVPQATVTHLKSTSYGRRNDVWRTREYYRSLRVYFSVHDPQWMPLLSPLMALDRIVRRAIHAATGREPLR